MPQAKTEVALQFLECCAAETALQHWLFCSADVICTKNCTAANEKLHCNIEIAALQESGAFLPLSCGFQAPTFRHPRFGLAEENLHKEFRRDPGRGGQGGGLGAQILYVGVCFSQQNTVHKEFREGGGSKGVLGVGSKVQFWENPFLYVYVLFWGLSFSERLWVSNAALANACRFSASSKPTRICTAPFE